MSKQSIDRSKYIIEDKENETIIKNKGDINGFNFKIRRLNNCQVYLNDRITGVPQ